SGGMIMGGEDTITVALSLAVVSVFSSSSAWTMTVLTTVPAFCTALVAVKVKLWPGASTMGLPPFAAMAAVINSPSLSSRIEVIVTGSVLGGLVLVIVKV